jgi:RHS repeat-associated protein
MTILRFSKSSFKATFCAQVVVLSFVFSGLVARAALSGCIEGLIESKQVVTNWDKTCSFPAFTNDVPPIQRRYLQETAIDTFEQLVIAEDWSVTPCYEDDPPSGSADSTFVITNSLQRIQTLSRISCLYTQNYSGNYFEEYDSLDTRRVGCSCPSSSGAWWRTHLYNYEIYNRQVDFGMHEGVQKWRWTGTHDSVYESNSECSGITNTPPTTYSTNAVDLDYMDDTDGIFDFVYTYPTLLELERFDSFSSWIRTFQRENEYTDPMLSEDIRSLMSAYPDWSAGAASAYFSLDETHIYGAGARMKYRFKIPDTDKDETYLISWDELTTYANGSVSTNAMAEEVEGTGDPEVPVYSSEHEVDVPSIPSIVTVENVVVSIVPPSGGGGGGGGGFGGGGGPGSGGAGGYGGGGGGGGGHGGHGGTGGGGGCGTCAGGGSNGGGGIGSGAGPNGPAFSSSMGAAGGGRSAGRIYFGSSTPSYGSFNPAALRFAGVNRPDVDVVITNDVLRQIKTPQSLADIIPVSTNSYEIRYYYAADVGTKGATLYSLIGTPIPFVTWQITNSNPASAEHFRLSEIRNGNVTRRWDYTYVSSSGAWKVQVYGVSIEEEVNTSIVGSVRWQTNIVRDPSAPTVNLLRVKRAYQMFEWGEGLIEVAYGEEGDLKKTTYEYYESSPFLANGTREPLKIVTHPEGSWEYYHSYDSEGRPTQVYSSFGNVSSGSYSSGRLTTYTYGQLGSSPDDGDISPDSPRLVTETLQGYPLSKRYTVFPSAYVRLDIQCGDSLGSWNASDNLITTNLFYASGTNQFRVKAVVHPDRTMQTFDYTNAASGYRTNITASGQPNSTFTHIVDGSSNRMVLNQFGYPVSAISWDIKSGIKTSQTLHSNFDGFGRPQTVTYLDGTTEHINYDCCAIDSRIDREGVQTFFGYDLAKRPTSSWRLGITNRSVLDAVGRTLQRIRIGTNGNQIIQAQYKYDSAGELLFETNALNGVTSYTESTDGGTGEVTHTNTYPDGGTRIEIHFRDGSVKKVTGTTVAPVRYEYGVESVGSYPRSYIKEIRLNLNGTDTDEWTKSYTDTFGRTYKTVYAAASSTPASTSFYNNLGQLWKQMDPDGLTTLFGYNAKGEQAYTAMDSNRNDLIDFSGSDRIIETTNWVETLVGTWSGIDARIQNTYVWNTDGNATRTLLSTVQSAVNGLRSANSTFNNSSTVTSQASTLYVPGSQLRLVTNTAPDNSYTATTNQSGRVISVTRYNASGSQIGHTTFGYDPHGRQNVITDARNGSTTNWFNNADQISSTKTPVPGAGQSAQVTTNLFDNMGRIWKTTLPDNTSVTNRYAVTGLLTNTFGSRTYPVAYTYDYAGRMKTMKTWQNFANDTGAAITTWNYDPYRGWLEGKRYEDDTGPDYTYTAAGRLETRTWARTVGGNPLVTTYSYNHAGDLSGVDYSDATPDVTYGYDRRGRQITITQSESTAATLKYDIVGNLLSESYSDGPLNGLTVTNRYDSLMRLATNGLWNGSTWLAQTRYTYDSASRLATVAAGNETVAYSYLANSPLVTNIWFTNNSTLRMITTKNYDFLNRLTGLFHVAGGSNVAVFNYANNAANQRTAITNVDNSRWVYQYDTLGQVVSGKKYWADGMPVAGQQFEYGFDDIGNRKVTASGGDAVGANLHYASYSANLLNQYTNREVPGFVNVIGTASNLATVTLWGDNGAFSPTSRKGDYFRGELAVTNTANPVWLTITNLAVLNNGSNPDIVTNAIGRTFVSQTPELFYYDADGNLTNDGRWIYTWDAENRLTKVESITSAPTASKRRVVWEFDGKGRRVRQTTSDGSSGSYVATEDLKFAADGWRHIAELNATNNALLRSYSWGKDLSGSLDGAGGVGGLLMLNSVANGFHYYGHDGNGNTTVLVKVTDGSVSQKCEYEPFGKLIRNTGLMAGENRFLFSTKRWDATTDLLLYEYRVLRTDSGGWLSRDPIGESGGINLHGFAQNSPYNRIEVLGLFAETEAQFDALLAAFDKKQRCCAKGTIISHNHEVSLHVGFRGGDWVSWVADAWGGLTSGISLTVNEGEDIASLVSKIEARLSPKDCIKSISFSGHGSAGSIGGSGNSGLNLIAFADPASSQSQLMKYLRSRLCFSCDVKLKGCDQADEGSGINMLKAVSSSLGGVPVSGWNDTYAACGWGDEYTACGGEVKKTNSRSNWQGTWKEYIFEGELKGDIREGINRCTAQQLMLQYHFYYGPPE